MKTITNENTKTKQLTGEELKATQFQKFVESYDLTDAQVDAIMKIYKNVIQNKI